MDNCSLAEEITRSVAPIFIYLVIVNFCVIISCLYVALNLIRNTLFHIHLRILLMNVIIAMLFRTSFTTFRALLRLRLLLVAQSPCDFLEELSFCMAISSITLPAVKVVTFTYALITCERVIALYLVETYEQKRNIPLVLIIAALSWYGLPEVLYTSWSGFLYGDSGRFLPYCSSSTAGTVTIWFIFEWTIPVNLFNAIALITLHFVLKKKAKLSLLSTPMLSSRYEMRASLKSLKFILPNIFVTCGVSCLLQAMTIGMMFPAITSLQQAAIIKELSSAIIIPFQYFSFSIICFFRSSELRPRKFKRKRRKETNQLLENEKMDPISAMANMQNFWEMHELQSK
ncbi:unnamed protein product, partial [Mesorhabditis belari]|uniref:Uncharacterized protein n=1 Tax=Mesorhabditis belari TaxID=2138241 RepID=A0AAF3ELI3_9BILA